MKHFFTPIFFWVLSFAAKATTYYVSATGNDASNGKTISEAWQTLSKVNSVEFQPGDVILFQAGATFNGFLNKPNGAGGINGSPVTFSSYGGGRAIISSGTSEGIYIANGGNITIKNLVIKGAGYKATSMWANGINIYLESDVPTSYDNILVDNVDVQGYGGFGISISSESEKYGYNHINITNSLLHENGMGGAIIVGSWDDNKYCTRKLHTDAYIANCKAYNNHGRSDYQDNWSGSGILISGITGALMEYCEAYENGRENGCIAGPVGLWMGEATNVVIQHCISHHNRSGNTKNDGGGFDIDGGCENSVIQDCDSYENEGYGYAMVQWETGNIWSNDTIRNNTSVNDARNFEGGALTFWGADSKHKVTNAEVYGNSISMDKTGKLLAVLGSNFLNVRIHDNQFCFVSPATFSNVVSSKVSVTNNSFPCQVLSVKVGSFNVRRVI